ncbi:class I SAM-dependent DNA methyltransferase [Thalassobacillus hwangdonensis]|uniref:Class I SAM-dependent DNA methyltransferase n=2 Tax=Thalassobacillus hwangdonensis TaxID=546108 RepID=A0ABW3KZ58_9BACI
MALVYDELMKDAPYDEWSKYAEKMFLHYGEDISTVLDLGCGTGEVSLRLSQAGYRVSGVDLSPDMLTLAQSKTKPGDDVTWVQQDIRYLEGFGGTDAVISFCDVLNYITEEADIRLVFSRVSEALKQGGIFLFDVHSRHHFVEHMEGQTFAEVYDEVSYIWFCRAAEVPGRLEHDLTFFIEDGDIYRRADEIHVQQSYLIEELQSWLHDAGFEVEAMTADFKDAPITKDDDGDRIFFACRKK